jgi:hypothetical protein
MSEFKIAAFINDVTFSANLAYTCNSLGYGLSFPQLENYSLSGNCVIIDLNDESLNPFVLGKTLRKNNIVVFGLVNRLNKTLQKKATKAGFDLVFPKSLFCKNLSVIASQVKNAR